MSQVEVPRPKHHRTIEEPITFFIADTDVLLPYNTPVVFFLAISNYDIRRILVDNGRFVDILFYDTFFQIGLPKDCLQRAYTPLIGFSGNAIPVEGIMMLPVIASQSQEKPWPF